MVLTMDLGILAAACALFYLGAKVIGTGEKELVYTQYIQIISKWLFLLVVLVAVFEIMGVYGAGGVAGTTTSLTSNVPLFCSGAAMPTTCGTTTEVTTVTVTGGVLPELTYLFMGVLALWLAMFVLDIFMLLPKMVGSLRTRAKR